jgi:beta-glucosidase
MDETKREDRALGSRFPPGFLFGASTSAFQIEGSPEAEGKGPSIWDRFAAKPGAVAGGAMGARGCDHYRLWKEDLGLMARLGLEAYRFSISWPRIQPSGRGAPNAAGLAFYDRLVDGLLASGIAPLATLYHWDLPAALQDAGGWPERDTAERFAEYAGIVAEALGDRIPYFVTLNEPWMFSFIGNLLGWHAPGKRNPWTACRVLHGALQGHGLALRAIKAERPGAKVGIALSLSPIDPATDSEKDRAAAARADLFMNRLLLDPLLGGSYPEEALRMLWPFFPKPRPGELETIAAPLDFVGVNSYTRERARHDWRVPIVRYWTDTGDVPQADYVKDGIQYTDMGYEVRPESLRRVLERLRDEYGNPPMYITENGSSFADRREGDRVHDPKRVSHLEAYLAEAATAIEGGCDLRGYFYWSLLDNLEWSFGYGKRHGLVRVDFDSQERTIKDSGFRYAEIVAEHRAAGGGRTAR